ncbi:MAG: quinol:cytochrome C oxidoreductase [Flavobacteriales bacterium]|nr:quinol:cytochrome C oxidoreductase [Flavobacteriales bacterium]
MIIGVIAMIVGFMNDHSNHHGRFWANILTNGFFFFAISLGGLFFLALQYATEASYMVVLKRIIESITQYIFVGATVLIIFFIAASAHWNHIYHWMDNAVYHEYVMESTIGTDHPEYVDEMVEGAIDNEHYDKIIDGKSAYLNLPFFWIRTLLYLGVWCFFAYFFRKRSLMEDEIGGTKIHLKNMGYAAIFLVFFAFTSSTAAWDWIMSIDTHWFSTLFGWYVFSGIWVSFMIFLVLFTIWLRGRGFVPFVNDSHIHDIGKWMFAISFLWTYLWFSQFMLIWYSDIPEEVTYYVQRITEYKGLFFGIFFTNFVFPMVILMSRDAKRTIGYLIFVGVVIFFGHWLDVYMMIFPGGVGGELHIGFMEIGMFLGFLGLFLYTVFNSLSKAPILVKNHPFLEESKHLHI